MDERCMCEKDVCARETYVQVKCILGKCIVDRDECSAEMDCQLRFRWMRDVCVSKACCERDVCASEMHSQ